MNKNIIGIIIGTIITLAICIGVSINKNTPPEAGDSEVIE